MKIAVLFSVMLAVAACASSSTHRQTASGPTFDVPSFQGRILNLTDDPLPKTVNYLGSCDTPSNTGGTSDSCGAAGGEDLTVNADGGFSAPAIHIPKGSGDANITVAISFDLYQAFSSSETSSDLTTELKRLLLIDFHEGHSLLRLPNGENLADWLKREKVEGIAVNATIKDAHTKKRLFLIDNLQHGTGGSYYAVDENVYWKDRDREFFGSSVAGYLNKPVEVTLQFTVAGDMGRFQVADYTTQAVFNRDLFQKIGPIDLRITAAH